GRKILMSGGGRCNFTNMYAEPAAYLSQNPHFCKSALARYTQWDFIELVSRYQIAYHEKTLGQLFCDDSAEQIVDMLLKECELGQVVIRLRSEILNVERMEDGEFSLQLNGEQVNCRSLVIASGGLSMPGLGATPFGYKIAEQFGLKVLPTRAALVPFTLHKPLLDHLQTLSGVAVPSVVTAESGTSFRESILFTHRGLSGPAILQLSSYWQAGEKVTINLLPDCDLSAFLDAERAEHPNQSLKNTLAKQLPKRLVECLQTLGQIPDVTLKQLNAAQQMQVVETLQTWQVIPNGTEGYRTAEVTLGGVDTNELSSKTMQAHKAPGLFFIGEVVDVTGWLGGYNFQWAWSSAWACAQALAAR
ncbi:MAG: NAD(P)/FAD-dependent oxidoreductase, partial [Enterobacterales bacterium]|nr:NAD(P)/FAD-dependent oxidoreductase [Enterobacterales bacterium]